MGQIVGQTIMRGMPVRVVGDETFLLAGDARDQVLRQLKPLHRGQLRKFDAQSCLYE